MKKLASTIIILFLMYIGFQVLFNIFGSGHSSTYTIKDSNKTFKIREIYTAGTEETNTYYLEISADNEIFNVKTTNNFFGGSRILKEITYFENSDYKCIFPTFTNKQVVIDMLCKKENIQYLYNNIKGSNPELDSFAISLKDEGYDEEQFADNKVDVKITDTMTTYTNNIVPNHFLTINNYRGLFTINESNLQKMHNVPLFQIDTYARPISALVDKYYITADYSQKYNFDKFKIVDITTNKVFDLFINGRIEHTSIVQGVVDNKMYLLDSYNKKQYEVRINPHSIVEIGNEQTGVKYYNFGEWTRISMADAVTSKKSFGLYKSTKQENFERVDQIGSEEAGFIYYFKKENNAYSIYRASQKNSEILTKLFETRTIEQVKYINDFIYFNDGKDVKYYHDNYGLRTLFSNSELQFNESLHFSVYKK